ncbi:MAG: hypothetical protein LBT80_00205 [Lactobacillaceae bacterium]|jgi:hypothetical protein|nr:hypothetical protein [Lactobacillaceae bacterium]
MELPLVASALTNSLGASIIGTVGNPAAIITITLPDEVQIQPEVDASGNFIVQIDLKHSVGIAEVVAVLPDDLDSWTKIEVTMKSPKPIVTALISTQGNTRVLEGSVNQAGLYVEVLVPENPHPIQVPVDERLEFALPIPIELQPKDLKLSAMNPITGEKIEVPVDLGVTTKTMTIPILTDEMIANYSIEAEKRRAAQLAHDQRLMNAAIEKEAFVTSIVDTIVINSGATIEPQSVAEPVSEASAAPVVEASQAEVVQPTEPVEPEVLTLANSTPVVPEIMEPTPVEPSAVEATPEVQTEEVETSAVEASAIEADADVVESTEPAASSAATEATEATEVTEAASTAETDATETADAKAVPENTPEAVVTEPVASQRLHRSDRQPKKRRGFFSWLFRRKN